MSSETPPNETVQDIQVRLKPFLGIDPKYYLAVIYSVIVLAVIFVVLFVPGVTTPGSRVTITSVPSGAAVTFGNKHWGTTPLTAFLPEGKAVLTVAKPGFQPVSREYTSGNALVLGWAFPKTDALAVTLTPTSADGIGDFYRAQVGRWALAVPFTSDYRFPPLFTRFATDARAAGWDNDRVKSFLLSLRPAVADPQMYVDYGRALGLWGLEATAPEGLEAQFHLWSALVGTSSDRLALWLLANQPKPIRDREVAEPSDWWKARVNGFVDSLKPASTPALGTAVPAFRTAVGSFRGVPGMTYLWGSLGASVALPTEPPYELPVPVTTAPFWIADSDVTQEQFLAFIAANPRWAPSNRDALIAAGQVDQDYLPGWTDGKASAPSEPVVSVSWYAAQAYVDWVNTKGGLPGGKKAVLPDEFQWEAAARSPGGSGMVNQGVWEWTGSAWYPGQSLVWESVVPRDGSAYARSLKGGVQNTKGSVKPGDRAGWPAAGATTSLGFRLALVGSP